MSPARLHVLPITHATRTFKVYTRTGDEGTSMLFNAERRAKDDAVLQALGSTDARNACGGIARAHAETRVFGTCRFEELSCFPQ